MAGEIRVDDLTELWQAGAVHLPRDALQYTHAARRMHMVHGLENQAFSRTGGNSPMYGPFTYLRRLMQDQVAVKSRDNLVSAGEVITRIVDSFATVDHLNAEQLAHYETFLDEYPNRPAEDQPPATVPEALRSHDLHAKP